MARRTNCKKNGQDYFRVTLSIGKSSDGKAIKKEFYGKSKKEAEQKRDEYKNNIQNGAVFNFDKMLLGEFFKIWLYDVKKLQVKENTMNKYDQIYRCHFLSSMFPNMLPMDIRPLTIQYEYVRLHKNGSSEIAIRDLHMLLHSCFKYAVLQGIVLSNPCIGINIPKDNKEKKQINVFKKNEIEILLNSADDTLRALLALTFFSGMRFGEVAGLLYKNINFDKNELYVVHTLKRVKDLDTGEWSYKLDSPKTKSSKRTIPINSKIIPLLKKHVQKEKEKCLSLGCNFTADSLIFTNCALKPLNNYVINIKLKNICKKNNIEYRSFHNIRHTFATSLFEEEERAETIQALLGHSSMAMTVNTYTHVSIEKKGKATEKLNERFDFL